MFNHGKQLVLDFGQSQDAALVGGKGAGLSLMVKIGLPVPPGFTIPTTQCAAFYAGNQELSKPLQRAIIAALKKLERQSGKKFGGAANPLLLSVRSGSKISMPGMMDTILNLGLNDTTVLALAKATNNPRFAYDCYRRLIQMYSAVVLGIAHHDFEEVLDKKKRHAGVQHDSALTAEHLQELVQHYLALVRKHHSAGFPQDPTTQLLEAVAAVFKSWQNTRAITYRRLHDISDSLGTAVTVQSMVFGNLGDTSATGVAFTRNPSTGVNEFYGEYLINAQGEDVVAGLRTPQPLATMATTMPAVYQQLQQVRTRLENHCRDMQDIEFTVEAGKLYLLQTRSGKRTAAAAIKIAVDMVTESIISQATALQRIDPLSLNQLLHPSLDPNAPRNVLARGLPASPGAASGAIALTADTAEHWAKQGYSVILVRQETSPEDIHGMHAATGILTARGGMTSHAAVVARGMGRPCVCGAAELHINSAERTITAGSQTLKEGSIITIDGASGEVIIGDVPRIAPTLSDDFHTLMGWADATRRLRVRVNADTPQDAETAIRFGAEGIGLCRTEHMFFDPARILVVRQMLLAENTTARAQALASLLPHQRDDFTAIFKIMAGRPVCIRLLDPPLHEFLPQQPHEFTALAASMGVSVETLHRQAKQLHEANPMLGHRGCRLGITFPEIYTMQVQAIMQAAVSVADANVEIMIPLIAASQEYQTLHALVHQTAAAVCTTANRHVAYKIGTMIELPRACLVAGDIANHAEFFSFGTNDLTQTTWGLSRDDAGSFLPDYLAQKIIANDPFVTLDTIGVGGLMVEAVRRGKQTRPDLKLGICGEHGGDPASVAFCHRLGLDYVSCSPYRVPIARLAAAQASLTPELP